MIKQLLLTSVLLSMPTTAALADTTSYFTNLNGANQNPPNASEGAGTALLSLNGDLLSVDIAYSGLSAPAFAAHIHCCAALGTDAPVVVPFSGFPASTFGTYANTIDLATFTFSGGATEASLIAGLNDGQAYVNIHDANYPAGEIRGQLSPVSASAVPEPGSLVLLGTGMVGIVGIVRRRLMA